MEAEELIRECLNFGGTITTKKTWYFEKQVRQ